MTAYVSYKLCGFKIPWLLGLEVKPQFCLVLRVLPAALEVCTRIPIYLKRVCTELCARFMVLDFTALSLAL